jgi:hypothetical protein
MFGWLKKSNATPPLHFKDAEAAFYYACEFLQNGPSSGAVLPALVLDARTVGGEVAVKVQPDGTQITMLKVCSKDGGFMVMASSAHPQGPRLKPGDLVAWQAGSQVAELASLSPDPRSTWVGLVVAKLLPEYTSGRGWAIAQPFGRVH